MGEHEKPGSVSAWIKRALATVRRFLKLEPAVVGAVVRTAVILAGTLGVVLPSDLEPRVTQVFVALVALVTAIDVVWTRSRVTPAAVVVEKVEHHGTDVVVAGPANDQVEPGAFVRRTDQVI